LKQRLCEVLAWQYPFAAATQRAAKSSVTALRRQAAEDLDDEAEQVFRLQLSAKRLAPPARNPKLSAADAGTAHHKFLERVALANANNIAALTSEANRLEQEKVLSADERTALALEDIAAFWNSEPGRKIRAQAANVRRELAFTARFSPAELAAITGAKSEPGLEDEFVVVQGVADLVVLLPEEIWLADFKTDEIRQDGLPDKIKAYAPQLKLYAQALAKIYSRPVTERWLHFLAARRTEKI
jgi:ATP-dependent helicase/nuclease subunit A